MGLENQIRVSKDTYKYLNGKKDQGETFNDVIRRELGLKNE